MRNTLILTAMLAIGLTACGKKEEAQTEPAPAPVAEAPTPAPAPMEAAPAEAAAPAMVDGAAKYTASCASCHGANGQGMAAFPKLSGLTPDVVKARLADYKAGKQVGPQSAVMMPIASMLSDAEVDALATHIAGLK